MSKLKEKSEAMRLHFVGLQGIEIAKRLDVSEKTVVAWLKGLRRINYATHLKKLHIRFDNLVSNPKADIKEIHNLSNVIASIEKRIKDCKIQSSTE